LDSSAIIEIEVYKALFPEEVHPTGEVVRGFGVDPEQHPGILSIARVIKVLEDKKNVWLACEVGADTLASQLTVVKGEFFQGERIYNVAH